MAGIKRLIGGASNRKQPDIDPWDAIEIFCPKTLVGGEIYLWGCALKHLIQLGFDDSPIEDIKKAENFLRKLRETLENKLTGQVTITEDRMIGPQGPTPRPPPTPNPKPPNHAYGYTPLAYKRCDGAAPPEED